MNYEASHDRVNLITQRQVLEEELSSLDDALADADDAIAKLKGLYADGIVRSPVSGSIGASVPFVGNVYRPGEPILSIYSGDPYVLVYLPRRYLFPIYVGMELRLTDGRDVADGIITEILPVTDTLPKEFQNTFKPSDRNQLAKIKTHDDVSVPAEPESERLALRDHALGTPKRPATSLALADRKPNEDNHSMAAKSRTPRLAFSCRE